MSRPYSVEEGEIKLASKFKRRIVFTDLNKDYFLRLEQHKHNDLIIDFIDERFNLYQIGYSYVTRSGYFVDCGLFNRLGGRLCRKTEMIDDWEYACLNFINKLRNIYSPRNITLHKAFFALEYFDENGDIQRFDPKKEKIYKQINRLLEHYYSFFEDNLPGINIIELPKYSYRGYFNHKWGLGPYHYEYNYYQSMLKKVNEIYTIA